MHKKYASQGLAVISVALDKLEGSADEQKALLERVRKFLRDKDARFTNVLLDDAVDWSEKFHFVAPPCYFVFNKQGKWRQFTAEEGPVDYGAMERLVVEFFKEK